MKYERKVNLNIKSCSDISELEDIMRNCSECKKLLETKKVGPNTRRCQKIAEQRVESPKLSRASSYTSNTLLERLAEKDWCTWFPILTPEFSLPSHWVPRSRSLTSAKGRTIRKLMGDGGGGGSTKNIFAQGKIKWKKISCTPINPKKIFMLWPKKNSYKEFATPSPGLFP